MAFEHFCYIAAVADDAENVEDLTESDSTEIVPNSTHLLASQHYLSPEATASKAADASKKGQ